jgi:predicted CoA-substrate-specific enzyme activase
MKRWAGIDLGSISLKWVVIDEAGRLLASEYKRTDGRPLETLLEILAAAGKDFPKLAGIVSTGSGRRLIADLTGALPKNEILTQARGAIALTPDVRSIIEIGGQDSKFIAVTPDPISNHAAVIDHSLNEVCAAGTGSFLDQQAARLGLSIEELGQEALHSTSPAFVAGRCAVFAKSDLMHLQQAGVSRRDILAGLCMALARNYLSSVGKGRKLETPINFQGGVAANPAVVRAFETVLQLPGGSIRVPPHYRVLGALGAALAAQGAVFSTPFRLDRIRERIQSRLESIARSNPQATREHNKLPPLSAPERSKKISCSLLPPSEGEKRPVYLGVDVGASSAKLVLTDPHGRPLTTRYALTRGDPLGTIQRLLTSLGEEAGDGLQVLGVGVTGSGRGFIGAWIGADVVINEISAQARAALHLDPEVDTLIEIGGQDSKYIRFENGAVVDFEMNRACAAGTGSFLEEQAARLGIRIEDEFAELAFTSNKPADLGTRCTVFMESDLIHHQQQGEQLNDLVAGLAYGVVLNYLENVVGSHPIGENIHFQGGIASNGAVVSALENKLKKKVKVSSFHQVTGAWGAALYAQAQGQNIQDTRFQGFELDLPSARMSIFNCQGCDNVCRITRYVWGKNEEMLFGGICDRYESAGKQVLFQSTPDLLEQRLQLLLAQTRQGSPPGDEDHPDPGLKKTIGMPRALFFYDHFPLWYAFLQELGFTVVLSAKSDFDLYYRGLRATQSDSCLPVKMLYGHILDLIEQGVPSIFLPNEIELPHERDDLKRSYNCPYIQGAPYMMRAVFKDRVQWITPDVYMAGSRENLQQAMSAVARQLDVSEKQASAAVKAARRVQAEFRNDLVKAGRSALEDLDHRRAVVLLGKPHHLFDDGLNLHIGKKLRKLGVTAVPYDFLPLSEVELPESLANVTWKNAHDLLRAAVLAKELRFPTILLSNFGCGPDSFTIQYLDEILTGHPHLVLEVDDHTSDAGLITRLEAFFDTLKVPESSSPPEWGPGWQTLTAPSKPTRERLGPSPELLRVLDGRKLYFPYVSPGMSEILKAAIRLTGIEAEILPPPDSHTEELGKKHALGSECHPFIVTLGDFVKLTETPGFDPAKAAVAMFNYDGACRLSQYTLGHKLALKKSGYADIPVLGPIISTRRDEFSRLFGLRSTMALWKGWLAAEVLERQLLATRPYEKIRGSSDKAYLTGIHRIALALDRSADSLPHKGSPFVQIVKEEMKKIRSLPVNNSNGRPKIGVLGEFYTALNSWANADLFAQLEELGMEVKSHGIAATNFILLFAEHYHAQEMRRRRKPLAAAFYTLRRHWMVKWADALEDLLDDSAGDVRLLHSREIMEDIAAYIHSDIDPVATTFTARFLDFNRKGAAGVNYVMVLNCMLSNMTLPIFRSIAAQNHDLPILATPYSGLKTTNIRTRLEAFVEQAQEYHDRYLS